MTTSKSAPQEGREHGHHDEHGLEHALEHPHKEEHHHHRHDQTHATAVAAAAPAEAALADVDARADQAITTHTTTTNTASHSRSASLHTPSSQTPAAGADRDVEKHPAPSAEEPPDIEHAPVIDDPRLWSESWKWCTVAMLAFGALIPTMAANIFFPAIGDVERDLHATQSTVALSVSLYILAQGTIPLLWSPLSELIGRKPCFLAAMCIFTVAVGICSAANSIGLLIAMRIIQASGSSAMLAIAAGTLADMYEPHERGAKVGVYYAAPILGPSLAPVFGGALTEAGSWRTTFYFMAACGGASFVSFLFFKDTFRTQRSLAWQTARARAMARAEKHDAVPEHGEKQRNGIRKRLAPWRKRADASAKDVTLPTSHAQETPNAHPNEKEPRPSRRGSEATAVDEPYTAPRYQPASRLETITTGQGVGERSTGGATVAAHPSGKIPRTKSGSAQTAGFASRLAAKVLGRTVSRGPSQGLDRVVTASGEEIKVKPRLSDVSPLGSAAAVLRQPHNVLSLIYSGLLFGSNYSLTYTASRTFAASPYNYDPLEVGLVLLALGAGGVFGSILGGKYSDHVLATVRARDGRAEPEERIRSVLVPMVVLPPMFVAYAWLADYHIHVAACCVVLFLLGFAQIWIYSSTLSYVVDSNKGRSSGAVACNSAFRGTIAFIASEVAGPLQNSVGDGPLYTGWAIILIIAQCGFVFIIKYGQGWRAPGWTWPTAGEWMALVRGRGRGRASGEEVGEKMEEREKTEEEQAQTQNNPTPEESTNSAEPKRTGTESGLPR